MNPKELLEHILFTKITDNMVMIEADDIVPIIQKQIPMNPIVNGEYMCPKCDITIAEGDNYCWMCGQAIKWEDDTK